jgi:chromosome segregation ATPase
MATFLATDKRNEAKLAGRAATIRRMMEEREKLLRESEEDINSTEDQLAAKDTEIATLRRLLGELCEAEQRMRERFNTQTWMLLCSVSDAAQAYLSGEQP